MESISTAQLPNAEPASSLASKILPSAIVKAIVSHDLKMDNSGDGSGFEDQRTNDAAAYSAYSARFERICDSTIVRKYADLIGKRGVGAQRKATQRARSKVANTIMQMNTALNTIEMKRGAPIVLVGSYAKAHPLITRKNS